MMESLLLSFRLESLTSSICKQRVMDTSCLLIVGSVIRNYFDEDGERWCPGVWAFGDGTYISYILL